MKLTVEEENPLYFEPFTCLRCGNCCTGDGFVNLTPDDCERLAKFLGLEMEDFYQQYTTFSKGYQRWLKDGEGDDQPCIFLDYDAEGLSLCKVHGEAKPEQCQDFPRKWSLTDADQWCAGLIAEKKKKEVLNEN